MFASVIILFVSSECRIMRMMIKSNVQHELSIQAVTKRASFVTGGFRLKGNTDGNRTWMSHWHFH